MVAVSSALIIGGGICGLTTAIALSRIGIEVQVFEQAAEVREVGAGLTLWANGLYALEKLGLGNEAIRAGQTVKTFRFLTMQGKTLGDINIDSLAARMQVPNVSIHRKELIAVLEKHTSPESVFLSHELESFTQNGDMVTARFAGGQEHSGDILLACDGFHSRVREQMLGSTPAKYAGYTCWRGLAPLEQSDQLDRSVIHTFGCGAQFGALDVGNGLIAWYGTGNTPPGIKESPLERKLDALKRFAGWHQPIPEILQRTEASDYLKNDIYDRQPVRTWAQGRVLLMGDAAHPTTPNLGQGACQAIEDAAVLAEHLESAADYTTAFQEYCHRRMERTAEVVLWSRRTGQLSQVENPILCGLRDWFTGQSMRLGTVSLVERTICYKV